jgi:serine protease DegQ
MVTLSGQMGVPVIVVDKQVIVGFNKQRLDQLLASSVNGHKISMGLSIADAYTVMKKAGHIPVDGAYIGRVTPGSSGDKAGLKPGDIIINLNSKPVNNAADIENVMSSIQHGSPLTISFLRGQDKLNTKLAL